MDKRKKVRTPPAGGNMRPENQRPENDASKGSESLLDHAWIESFYRECGREVTLAYTTLNQMKNWAMMVAAAALSGLAFGARSDNYPNKFMFVGVVIVYVFVLRFYMRAILCYINLSRWNRLQSDCVELKLLHRAAPNDSSQRSVTPENRLREDIQNYYFDWLSPIDRKTQLLSNLKLGFGLIFALTIFFLLWGLLDLWHEQLVKALLVFSIGTTIVEFNDFLKSSFFDTVAAYQKRKTWSKVHEIFPAPASRGWYLASWILVIAVSVIVAEWPTISRWLDVLLCRL